MKRMMTALAVAMMMAGASYADMMYDAGSDAGKGGYPDDAGSIVDAGSGSHFFNYNNAGAALSLSGDSYNAVMGPAASGKNTYSRVYFEGDDGSGYIGGNVSQPVADLGFDIHDPAIEYRIDYRVKVDAYDLVNGERAVRLYYRGGAEVNGLNGGLWAVDIKGVDSTGGGGAADSLSLSFFAGDAGYTDAAFSAGEWHDVSMVLKPHAQARPGELYLDGVLVDKRQWGSYWNANDPYAYMYLGNDSNGSADFSVDYINVVGPATVPEPASLALLGIGGLLLSLRRRMA